MLKTENLSSGYGDVQVLRDVDFSVNRGEVVSLIGSNGSGKSTLLKTISGVLEPFSGKITFEGREIHGKSSEKTVELGIVQVPEGKRLFPEMKVEENLLMGAYSRVDSSEIEEDLGWVFDLLPRLEERRYQKAETLSGGEQQMCALARGLMADPKLLMIDEMSLGLAPVIVDDMIETIDKIQAEGTTILLAEQDVKLALEHSDRGYVIETGEVTMKGDSKDLLAQDKIKEAYLGL